MELLRFFLITWLASVFAVDHSVFKTCEQSSFCRRCRNMVPDESVYELNLPTVQITDSNVVVELLNTAESASFHLTLTALVDKTFRLQIVETKPIRERFRAIYALKQDPEVGRLEVVERNEDHLTVKSGDYTATLYAKPFRLDFSHDGAVIISTNSRGLLKFEHYRVRSQPANPEETTEEETTEENVQPAVQTNEDPGAWEENFKSHRDTKPFGPSAVALDFAFPGAEQAYGIPEHADPLALRDTKASKSDPYRHYNLDVFEYELYSPMAIYGSIGVLYAHGIKNTVGVFWHNPTETWIDVSSSKSSQNNVVDSIVNFVSGSSKTSGSDEDNQKIEAHFMSETGIIDVFFLLGPKPKDAVMQYAKLTGVAPLPQYFAVAYHQSRWNYNDEDDVRTVSETFDEYDMPMDVMWLDIEYTDTKKYFTWDPQRFPHALEMQHNLTAQGRKLVVIIDPHIKRESGYFLHEAALANDFYVKNAEGNVYEGWCWPGASSYLDFLNPTVSEYYTSLYALDKYPQATNDLYVWNDMNEPSVFNGPEVTMPKDCMHDGGWEHRDIHNIYGLLHSISSFNGLLARSQGALRPFLLTRAHFAGSQRYTAVWTGDNAARWDHLKISLPMCLNLALGGMSFCGADIGGFFGDPDAELLTRWYQTGAFLPFYRAHAHLDSKRREPYLFPEDVRNVIRSALRLRYTFLPLWYTLFHEHEVTGLPVIRPIFFEFPEDPNGFTIDDEFLVGSSLLVHPVTEAGASQVQIYFPGGKEEIWYDIDTHVKYHDVGTVSFPVDIKKIPVFQRGGTIIPKKERVRRSSALTHSDPYTLVIALDNNKSARGSLYIDDGQSYEYRNGKYIDFTFEFKNNKLTAKFVNPDAFYPTKSWLERVVIVGQSAAIVSATAESKSVGKLTLEVSFDKQSSVLTVRKPTVSMAEEWTITLNAAVSSYF